MIISQITQDALGLLGNLIKTARVQRKITQADLAQRLDVARQTVVNIENGSPKTTIGTALEAARIVGIPVIADETKQLNQWQQVLNGFNALLPSKVKHKKIEPNDDF